VPSNTNADNGWAAVNQANTNNASAPVCSGGAGAGLTPSGTGLGGVAATYTCHFDTSGYHAADYWLRFRAYDAASPGNFAVSSRVQFTNSPQCLIG
jgi:hypothetical protein